MTLTPLTTLQPTSKAPPLSLFPSHNRFTITLIATTNDLRLFDIVRYYLRRKRVSRDSRHAPIASQTSLMFRVDERRGAKIPPTRPLSFVA